jgi:transcriptional regulator with XRE-family HTH domain
MELRQRRIRTGLKVKAILCCLGISRSTYYLIEIGKRKTTPEEEAKLEGLFCSIENARK